MIKIFLEKYANNRNQRSLSFKLRTKRFIEFIQLLNVDENHKILDVGGTEEIWLGSGLEKNVTLLNINLPNIKKDGFQYVLGDACDMKMFADSEFDTVFSNSVIEHVGDFQKQKLFAHEIMRVGKKYWVQTPYKHFPIEPHFLFPLFQYLSSPLQRIIGKRWKYSHLFRNGEDILDELKRLRLLNKKEMNYLFPANEIIEEKYFCLTKSLIAVKK